MASTKETHYNTPPRRNAEDIKDRWAVCCGCLPLVLVGILILGGYLLNRRFTFPTNDEIHAEINSPDRAYVAVIIVRPNGTLAPDEGGAERVLLRKRSEPFTPDREGHINIEPVYHDLASYGLEVTWKDARTLLVTPNGCWRSNISNDESEIIWNDVKIKYHYCFGTR